MATQYSNKPIVTNGLVYALDFGNQKSYVSGSSSARSLRFFPTTASFAYYGGLSTIPNLVNGLLQLSGSETSTGSQLVTNTQFSDLIPSGDFTVQLTLNNRGNGIFITQGPSDTRLISTLNTSGTALGWYINPLPYAQAGGPGGNYYTRNYLLSSRLQHLTYRYSSGSYDLFVNGIPVSPSGRYDNISTNTGNLTINGAQSSGFSNTDLGNFYIYDRALTANEIYSNYLIQAQRYGLPTIPKPYTIDENAYLFLSQSGITDPIITSSIDTFVRGLKSASLWDKMIAIYPFVGTGSVGVNLTGSQSWNLKEPTSAFYRLAFTGSWNGSTSGSTPSGSNTSINTGVLPYEYYPFKSDSNQHISILSYDTPTSSSFLAGTGIDTETAVSTLAGDYGTPAAAYSVRKVRTAYSGALMDVRRSIDNVTSSIGYVSNGDLDTGSLLNFVNAVGENSPGNFSGLAAAYSLRRVSSSYSGSAIQANNGLVYRDIGFDASGNLDTGSLTSLIATGSNVLAGNYSGLAAAYSLRRVVPGYNMPAIEVRRSGDNYSASIGFDTYGDLNTNVLSAFIQTGSETPLNNYSGLKGAYSLRKVVPNYTGFAIEIQSGSVSQSIGFDSFNELDTTAIASFAGSGNAFVKTWYDQSGNNNHATQSNTSIQPQIYIGSSGSVFTVNNKPAVYLKENDAIDIPLYGEPLLDQYFVTSTTEDMFLYPVEGPFAAKYGFVAEKFSPTSAVPSSYGSPLLYANGNLITVTTRGNMWDSISGNKIIVHQGANTSTWSNYRFSNYGASYSYTGYLQELIAYTSSQASNRNYIENNINSYYGVYAPVNTSTRDAFIKTWYDQSGNNYHATQSVAASQPQIVSLGTIITQSNRPTIQFDGSSDNLLIPIQLTTGFDIFKTVRYTNVGGYPMILSEAPGVAGAFAFVRDPSNKFGIGRKNQASVTFTSTGSNNQVYVTNHYSTGVAAGNITVNFRLNGGSEETTSLSSVITGSTSAIGMGNSFDYFAGTTHEILIYSSSQASNRTYITNNINAYYNIYTTSSTSTENAFVNTWYDQSGNNRHAIQKSTNSKILIVRTGSLVLDTDKPALQFINDVDSFIMPGLHGQTILDQYFVQSSTDTQIVNPDGTNGYGIISDAGSGGTDWNGSNYGTPQVYANNTLFTGSTRGNIYSLTNGRKIIVHQGATTAAWREYRFSGHSFGYHYTGLLQELIAYTSSQAANRPLIENNINNYYSIYTSSNAGFVARWYDQSGNNRHATQTATGSQPLIVLSGSVITEPTSSKPALNFDGTADYFTFTPTIAAQNIYSAFTVVFPTTESSGNDMIIAGGNGSTGFRLDGGATPSATITRCSQADMIAVAISGNIPTLATFITTNSDSKIYTNNILRGTGGAVNPINPILSIGSENGSQLYKNKMQEVVFYTTDQTTNREAVEYGINNYYRLYTQPTSSNWTTSSFTIKATPTGITGAINNQPLNGISSTGPVGFITVSRTGSNALTIARNGVTSSFTVPASGALTTGIYLGASNYNGIAVGSSPLGISFASVGTGLTGNDLYNLNRLTYNLQGDLGRPDPSATAFLLATGITDVTQSLAINNLVINLKSYGVWDKMKAIYPFVGGTANTHKFNLKDPRDLDAAFRLDFSGSWTHTSTGVSRTGTALANTFLNNATHLSLNEGSFGLYLNTFTGERIPVLLQSGSNYVGTWVVFRFDGVTDGGGSEIVWNSNFGGSVTPSNKLFQTKGFYQVYRNNSTQVNILANTTLATTAQNSSVLVNTEFKLGGVSNTGSYDGGGMVNQARFFYIGGGITNQDAANIYTAVQAFQTTLGRQV